MRIAEIHNHVLLVSKVVSVVDAEDVAMNSFFEQKTDDTDASRQLCIHLELGRVGVIPGLDVAVFDFGCSARVKPGRHGSAHEAHVALLFEFNLRNAIGVEIKLLRLCNV